MARITRDSLIAANKELEAKVTALEARLAIAATVYREQRAKIAEQDALLATRGCIATVAPAHPAKPETRTWKWMDRQGVEHISTRTGNRTVTRLAA